MVAHIGDIGLSEDVLRIDPIIDGGERDVLFAVEPGTDRTNLTPIFNLRPGTASSPASGTTLDLTDFLDPETGKCFLYWGNGRPVYAELSDDMTSVVPGTIRVQDGLTGYRESTFVNYREGMYHLTYSIDDTGSENYRVGYATSDSPHGPWTYRGVIVQKDASLGILGTGHNSVLNVPGTDDWYMVYHRFARFELHSTPVHPATVSADSEGRITTRLNIPADTTAGVHSLIAVTPYGELKVPVTVVSPAGDADPEAPAPSQTATPDDLAATGGFDASFAALLAFAAMLLGGVSLFATRVRKRSTC
nr:family 43 glycosylhydrolase [Microbacterium amylolyticum]